ncbi:hypothetical protein MSAN_01588700 [Mycena sanguinolenta]|uniref:Uncharacterized protein n=1 Tax=Mycena sanguinolenta TaxID=230812 RepID=A0A8H6Y4D2_9AGAR|nr:hypothetical protein MSAN_01588700 [Mycena sanguinolenta]
MSINAGAMRIVEDDSDCSEDDSDYVDDIGISVEAEQANIDPVVTLLETAAAFLALDSLTIHHCLRGYGGPSSCIVYERDVKSHRCGRHGYWEGGESVPYGCAMLDDRACGIPHSRTATAAR